MVVLSYFSIIEFEHFYSQCQCLIIYSFCAHNTINYCGHGADIIKSLIYMHGVRKADI